jgi:hypothetical protein
MRLKPFLADQELCRHASDRVLDACKSAAGCVDESNAIVKKKCDAEAAKSPQQRKEHTAQSTMMDDIIAVPDRAQLRPGHEGVRGLRIRHQRRYPHRRHGTLATR